MAFPWLLAGLALTGAGSALSAIQQNKALAAQQQAQNEKALRDQRARMAERARQEKIDQANLAEVRKTITETVPDKRAEAISEVVATGETPVQEAGARYAPLPRSTDVAGEVIGNAGELRDEVARRKAMINALAILSAQNSDFSGTSDAFTTLSSAISQNNSKGRGSLGALQSTLDIPAARVTARPSLLADMLKAGGQAASFYGGNQLATFDPFAIGKV